MKINCRFCDKIICIEEFDYAMWCKGENFLCEQCQEDFDNNVSKTRRIP